MFYCPNGCGKRGFSILCGLFTDDTSPQSTEARGDNLGLKLAPLGANERIGLNTR